jgi:hypothetical protein
VNESSEGSWEDCREDNLNKLHGGGASSSNLMAPTNTLNLEDLVAKFNMDIFKLQEDGKVAKDQMKAMKVRENVMEEKKKKYGEFLLFWSDHNVQVVVGKILQWNFQIHQR